MDKKNRRLTDEDLTEQACNIIDEVGLSIKKASRKLFNSLVSRTIETFSNTFDYYTNKAKQKIVKKGSTDVEENNDISE